MTCWVDSPENDLAILNGLSRTLATCPVDGICDGSRADVLALKADDAITGGQKLDVLDTLAAAYAESVDFDQAREVIEKAISLALRRNATAAVGNLESRLALYKAKTALREVSFRPLQNAIAP